MNTLTIDAGNSHLTLALHDAQGQVQNVHRLHTRPFQTVGQLVERWRAVLGNSGTPVHLSISSVVPDYHETLQEAGKAIGAASVHWVDVESPHGFTMQDSIRREIGADLIAGLVGARGTGPGPLLVVDAGTATTFALLSGQDEVLGVAILPGIKTQIKTLMEKAPHLADSIKVEVPERAYGVNTSESIQSGIMYGHAHMIEGLISRYRSTPGLEDLRVHGCGGLFTTIASLCPSVTHFETHLVNMGCLILGQRRLQEAL